MQYFIANWKQNFSLKEAQEWFSRFAPPSTKDQIIVATSHIHLGSITPSPQLSLAAQFVSPYDNGAHTGQIGAQQLRGLVDYCLVGHSETRKDHQETDQLVAQKVRLLQTANITPIVCLDLPYLESQIRVLLLELLEIKNLIFAYEPLSAIGTGQSESPQRANEIAFKITTLAHNRSLPILYGGSVDPFNVTDYLSQEYISGVLVGSASLDPEEFAKIIKPS